MYANNQQIGKPNNLSLLQKKTQSA